MTGKKVKVKKARSKDGPVAYEEMSVKELRLELRQRKLGQLGSKAALIKRLKENDAAKESGDAEAEVANSPLAKAAPMFSFMKAARPRADIESEMQTLQQAMAAATAAQDFASLAGMATQMAALQKELERAKESEPETASLGFDFNSSAGSDSASALDDFAASFNRPAPASVLSSDGSNRNMRLTATDDLSTALQQFMHKHDPSKAASATTLAEAIDGDTDAIRDLFLDLRKQYGVFPAWNGVKDIFGSGSSNTTPTKDEHKSPASGQSLSVQGINHRIATLALCFVVCQPIVCTVSTGLREALVDFYNEHAPAKTENVDTIVKIYGQSRETLVRFAEYLVSQQLKILYVFKCVVIMFFCGCAGEVVHPTSRNLRRCA